MIFKIIINKRMQKTSSKIYHDLCLQLQSTIDITYFLQKIKNIGFSVFALNRQFASNTNPNAITALPEYKIPQNLKILSRITITISQPAGLHILNQSQNPYPCDILAVRPLNEKLFHQLCTQCDSYDIITLKIDQKLPFMLKRNPVYQAIRRGKYFQLVYSPLFTESSRIIAMTNISNIIKATNHKNLILSSSASQLQSSNIRSPYDLIAMLMALGMGNQNARATIERNCEAVIGQARHRGFGKGAVLGITGQVQGTGGFDGFGKKLGKRICKIRDRIREKQKEKQKDKEKSKKMGKIGQDGQGQKMAQ